MTVFSIAGKDLKRIFRNAFTLVMMFAAPFLITGLFYFAFGNDETGEKVMEPVRMGIVDDDEGSQYFNAGEQLTDFFTSPVLGEVIEHTSLSSMEEGKQKINDGSLDLFLYIPADFSKQFRTGNPETALYADPALGVRKEIVSDLITDFVGTMAGLTTFFQVVSMDARKDSFPRELAAKIAEQFTHGNDVHTKQEKGQRESHSMVMLTMCAMSIFFIFFAASITAQGLVTEREEGTFQRMAVTPNRYASLLVGKFVGVFITITIQACILFVGATIFFSTSWSSTLHLIAITTATIISAGGFTIFLMSLVNNSRQVGAISGGVLTIAGMLGGLFTVGVPKLPGFFHVTNKLFPQGWALTGYRTLLFPSESTQPLWLSAVVATGFGIILLFAGTIIVNRKLR